MNATHTYEEIYRAARKSGGTADAVRAAMKAGLDKDRAVDLSWRIEAGKPTPDFAHDPVARAEWYAGSERANHPGD